MVSCSRRSRGLLSAAAAVLGLAVPALGEEPLPFDPTSAAGFAAEISGLVPDSPCAEIEVETGPGGTLKLSGHVGVEGERAGLVEAVSAMVGEPVDGGEIEVLGADFCRVITILDSYAESGPSLDLEIAGYGSPADLRDGQPLVVDLTVPQNLDYLYLAYLQKDGRVGHLGLLPVKEWAGEDRVRIQTGFAIGPPFGREIVVATATSEPLFAEARPAFERVQSFIPALRYALERSTSGGGGAAVDHVWLSTRP